MRKSLVFAFLVLAIWSGTWALSEFLAISACADGGRDQAGGASGANGLGGRDLQRGWLPCVILPMDDRRQLKALKLASTGVSVDALIRVGIF